MKINRDIIYIIIIGLLIFYLFFKKENKEPSVIKIDTPEIIGNFDNDTINNIEEQTPTVKDSIIINTVTIPVENPYNKELLEKYKQAMVKDSIQSDSLHRLKAYIDAITIRTYFKKFENEDLILNTKIKTTGYLNSLEIPEYTIKSKSLNIPTKEKVFSFFLGGGSEFNKKHGVSSFSGDLGFQNKKNNLLIFSYEKPLYEKHFNINVKYLIEIFNIKK